MTEGGRRMVAGLARGCHPGPTVAVTALVTALAAAAGRGAGGCLLVALAVLSGQLSIGWCNDAADAGRDAAAARADKPAVDGTITPRALWVAAAAALACCVPLSFASGALAGSAHLAGVLAAWGYDLGLKATVLSWAPYAVGFGVLPAFVTLGLPGEPWPAWWATAAAALLGVGAHLADVLPDLADDLTAGVRGWPQRLGAARLRALLPLPLLAATCLLVFGPATAIADNPHHPSGFGSPPVLPAMKESGDPAPRGLAATPLRSPSPAPGSSGGPGGAGPVATDPPGPRGDAASAEVPGTGVVGWAALAAAAGLAAAGLLLARGHPRVPFAAAVAVAGVDVALLLYGGASLTC